MKNDSLCMFNDKRGQFVLLSIVMPPGALATTRAIGAVNLGDLQTFGLQVSKGRRNQYGKTAG